MSREKFTDSAAILADYIFELNHSDEDGQTLSINVERTALTTGVGFVRQQGESSPRILNFRGSILTQTQYDAMKNYTAACATRTIFFTDVDGTIMEVLITNFTVTRQRVSRNPRSPTLLWKWTYQLQLEVIA